MNERPSPWLGGPGARWAQALLFVLHVALVVALVLCITMFWRIQSRLDLPGWQRASILAGLGAALAVFGGRGVLIGGDLWRAVRASWSRERRRR
jgi:hypothetical protein